MKNEAKAKETERRGTSALTRLLAPREIKFRALSNGNWKYGHYYNNREYGINQDIIVSDGECEGVEYIVEGRTVCEFTGLKDKNGKEIYEGDILQTKLGICYVIWSDAAFALKSPGSETVDWEHSSVYEKSEIIGNIFETPELIE